MGQIDFNQLEKQVIVLATTLFGKFTQQAIADGKAFLAQIRDQLITLAQQHVRGEITEAEYQDGLADLRELAKMEAIKQAGLSQVAIDNFTNGVLDIVIKAAEAAI